MKKNYEVLMIRWEPQDIMFDIEADNAQEARSIAVGRVNSGDFEEVGDWGLRPIRTTVMWCKKVKEPKT